MPKRYTSRGRPTIKYLEKDYIILSRRRQNKDYRHPDEICDDFGDLLPPSKRLKNREVTIITLASETYEYIVGDA